MAGNDRGWLALVAGVAWQKREDKGGKWNWGNEGEKGSPCP